MSLRIAHISDLHVPAVVTGDGEQQQRVFVAFLRRALPASTAAASLVTLASRPENRRLISRWLSEPDEPLLEPKFLLPAAALVAATGTLLWLYRRKVMEFYLLYRSDAGHGRLNLLQSLAELSYDHLVISGDLTLTASGAEFSAARAYVDEIRALHPEAGLTLVPGNHDVGSVSGDDKSVDLSGYFEHFGDLLVCTDPDQPSVTDLGDAVIFGLNSCTQGEGLGVRGLLGERQLGALDSARASAGSRPKIVTLHHHLFDSAMTRLLPALEDSEQLLQLCRAHQVQFVLHGHQHDRHLLSHGDAVVHCAGSSTEIAADDKATEQTVHVFELGSGHSSEGLRAREEETMSDRYLESYSEDSFWDKLKDQAIKAGKEVIEKALTLYYTMQDSDTPMKARATIAGALGYFIFPVDAIPDLTVGVGYADDLGVLVMALAVVAAHVKDEHVDKAKEMLLRWFG